MPMIHQYGSGRFGAVLLLLAGLSLPACGNPSTTFVSSWRAPKTEPLNLKGEEVAAVVMVKDDFTRKKAEDTLAGEITHYGGKGVPMYTLMSDPAEGHEAVARAAIERAGVKGIVVMRPKGTRKTSKTTTSYTGPQYAGYWGGYYDYGWGSAWGPRGAAPMVGAVYSPGTVETHTETTEFTLVEVLVYSLKQNQLVWAGESESIPPEKVDEFVIQVAAGAVKELKRSGLISD